jgi:hypothetical protein
MFPTYGRYNTSLPVLLKSCIDTCSNLQSICFAICINENDAKTEDFLREFFSAPELKNIPCIVVKENLPTPNLAIYFNMLYDTVVEKFRDERIVVSMFGDDMEFKTPGWEATILREINKYNGIGVYWCNDNYIGGDHCPVNLQVTQQMVQATEKSFMNPIWPIDYIDDVWYWLGSYTKSLHYLPHVIIQHNHNTKQSKDKWDPTFKRLRSQKHIVNAIDKNMVKRYAYEMYLNCTRKKFYGSKSS